MTEINFRGIRYGAINLPNDEMGVRAVGKSRGRATSFVSEEGARRWLGDYGLPSRLARRLLDAELRGIGPLANPSHALRA